MLENKSLLRAWNYNEDKLHHRCFDNDFKKVSRTNFLKNSPRQTLLKVALIKLFATLLKSHLGKGILL